MSFLEWFAGKSFYHQKLQNRRDLAYYTWDINHLQNNQAVLPVSSQLAKPLLWKDPSMGTDSLCTKTGTRGPLRVLYG